MIPKIIHYIWLGKKPKSKNIKNCIKSWQRLLTDYEIYEWNEDNIDINSHPYLKDAIEQKKYAFASDYIRIQVLKKYGGIYLDTDIVVFRSFDSLLNCGFFSAKEIFKNIFDPETTLLDNEGHRINKSHTIPGFGVMAAVIGANANHPFLDEILHYYNSLKPKGDGHYDFPIIDGILANLLENHGWVYKDNEQRLDNDIIIYPSNLFWSHKRLLIKDAYCYHACDNSWKNSPSNKLRIKLYLKRLSFKTIWNIQSILSKTRY
jgi:hypothetical protein